MPPKPKHTVLPLPGNSNSELNPFREMQEFATPTDDQNGNVGWDDDYGGRPGKPLTHEGLPFGNLKGGR